MCAAPKAHWSVIAAALRTGTKPRGYHSRSNCSHAFEASAVSHKRLRVYQPEIQSLDSAAAPAVDDATAVASAGCPTCNRRALITQSLDLSHATNGHDSIAICHLSRHPYRYRHQCTSNPSSLSTKPHSHDLPMHQFAEMGRSGFQTQGVLLGSSIRSFPGRANRF